MKHRCIPVFAGGVLAAFILGVSCARAERPAERMAVHGFLSQGYLASRGNNIFADTLSGTFQFNEFGINVSTDLTDRLRAGMQFFARDIGDLGNNAIKTDWAYADFRWRDWLGFRAGRIKCAGGLYLETVDLDLLRTFVFLPAAVYNESMRDVFIAVNGVSAYGYAAFGRFGDLAYQAAYGDINLGTDGAMAAYMESQSSARLTLVEQHPVLRAHLEWLPPFEGLRLTGSLMHTNIALRYRVTDDTAWAAAAGMPVGMEFPHRMDNIVNLTAGVEWAGERLTLSAEYDAFESIMTQGKGERSRERNAGYYAGLTYRLTERWEVGAYYAAYYADLRDRDGREFERQRGLPRHAAWQKDLTVAARLDLTDQWLVKAEVHWIDGTALILNQYNPGGSQREATLFAVKTTYSF